METKLNESLDENLCDYLFTLITKLDYLGKQLHPPVYIFQNQAGDMLNLCTSIIKTIEAAYKLKWTNGDSTKDVPIINKGVNDFLKMKELQFTIKEK